MLNSQKARKQNLASTLDSVKQTSIKVLADAASELAATAVPKLREAADRANHQVESFAEKARPQVEALAERARPQVEAFAEKARPQVEALAERARPQVEALAEKTSERAHALADRIDSYTPQATEKAGKLASDAATSLANIETPQLIDDLAVRLTGDKKAMKKARKALLDAGKKLSKQAPAKKSGKKALVWTLVVGSAAGIGYFVWKKAQPVEDPWSTPLPNNRPADARPVGSTPASRQATAPVVSETAVPAGKDEDAEETSTAKH